MGINSEVSYRLDHAPTEVSKYSNQDGANPGANFSTPVEFCLKLRLLLRGEKTHPCRLLERGQSNLKCGRKWPGEGSRPSPQSPKGILGFPPPDGLLRRTPKTKVNTLNYNDLIRGFRVKSPQR